jgi:hypothetical protein
MVGALRDALLSSLSTMSDPADSNHQARTVQQQRQSPRRMLKSLDAARAHRSNDAVMLCLSHFPQRRRIQSMEIVTDLARIWHGRLEVDSENKNACGESLAGI